MLVFPYVTAARQQLLEMKCRPVKSYAWQDFFPQKSSGFNKKSKYTWSKAATQVLISNYNGKVKYYINPGGDIECSWCIKQRNAIIFYNKVQSWTAIAFVFNHSVVPRFLFIPSYIDCAYLISPDNISVSKHSFQQWKYNYGSIMEPYSRCLFLSTNHRIIKRLQGEGKDVLCLTKVAIRPAYEWGLYISGSAWHLDAPTAVSSAFK